MGVNIKDVANRAQVSKATVSRVINDSPSISEKTKERVRRVMRELNYVPNSIARNFANQNTRNIALIVDIDDQSAFKNPFFYEELHGIETVIYREDYCLIIANAHSMGGHRNAIDNIVLQKRADGVIIPASTVSREIVRLLKDNDIPFVVAGEPLTCADEVNWVDINNRQGGAEAARHLLGNGYTRVAFLSGGMENKFNQNRYEGYRQALTEAGAVFDETYVLTDGASIEDGTGMMERLLSLPQAPDAVVCSNNVLAHGAVQAIRAAGLSIPGDVGIVGFDNYLAEFLNPPLTTVDINVFELGVQSGSVLMGLIKSERAGNKQILISTELIERKSSNR